MILLPARSSAEAWSVAGLIKAELRGAEPTEDNLTAALERMQQTSVIHRHIKDPRQHARDILNGPGIQLIRENT